MKKSGACPKCGSKKIGHLENVVHRVDTVYESTKITDHAHAPLGINREETKGILTIITEVPVGQLEAYLCADCGFYETYIKEPGRVPYDSILGFTWVNSP